MGISYTNLVSFNNNQSVPGFSVYYLNPTGVQSTPYFFKVLVGSAIDVASLNATGNFSVQLKWPVIPGSVTNAIIKAQDVGSDFIFSWIETNHTPQLAIAILTDGAGITNLNATINAGLPADNHSTSVLNGTLSSTSGFPIPSGETSFILRPHYGPAMFSAWLITNVAANLDARIHSKDYLGNVVADTPIAVGSLLFNGAAAVIPYQSWILPAYINTLIIGNRSAGAANLNYSLLVGEA